MATIAQLRRARDRMDRDYAVRFSSLRASRPRGPISCRNPIEQDDGLRDAAFRDPAGNLIRIQQNKEQQA